jgi:hypothetical protein
MQPGEVVLAHGLKQILGQNDNGEPTVQTTWAAPKGQDFVFVFLGHANRKGDPFAVEEAMERLGWQRKENPHA